MASSLFDTPKESISSNARVDALLGGCATCCCLLVFSVVDMVALAVAGQNDDSDCATKHLFLRPWVFLTVAGGVGLVVAAIVVATQCALIHSTSIAHMSHSNDSIGFTAAGRRHFGATFVSALFSFIWACVGFALYNKLRNRSCASSVSARMVAAWAIIHFLSSLFPLASILCGESFLGRMWNEGNSAETGDQIENYVIVPKDEDSDEKESLVAESGSDAVIVAEDSENRVKVMLAVSGDDSVSENINENSHSTQQLIVATGD